MSKIKRGPLLPDEVRDVKASVYDLSELACKQLLYGIITVLSFKSSATKDQFLEILDDAKKYNQIKKA